MIIYFSIYSFFASFLYFLYLKITSRTDSISIIEKALYPIMSGIFVCFILLIFQPIIKFRIVCFLLGGFFWMYVYHFYHLFIQNKIKKTKQKFTKPTFQFQSYIFTCIINYIFIFYIHPTIKNYIILNDITSLCAIIYIAIIFKYFIFLTQPTQKGLKIH